MPTSLLSGRSRLPLISLVIMDVAIAFGCAELSEYVRFGDHATHYLNLMYMQALLVVVFSFLCDVYAPWRGRRISERIAKVFIAWCLSFVALVAFLVMTKSTEQYSRVWLGIWIGTTIPMALVLRFALYQLLRVFRRRGRNTRHVLVIGDGRNFAAMRQYFSKDNGYGYRMQHIIKHDNNAQALAELEQYLAKDETFDECWLCIPFNKNSILQPVMFALRHSTANIRYMPGLQDLPLLNHTITKIGEFYSLDISCSPMDSINAIIKRVSDIVIGSLILLLISPVMIGVAIAVKLSSPGPVFFKQFRHGAAGQQVKVYKFRSMKVHQEGEGKVTQATKGDPRVTKVGAFIRRTSLDELPQFINVLQGRMSIVGPRPHALAHNEYYKDLVESYMKRHKVKPGITGLAQVRGFRGETDTLEKMERRVECDLEYINNWSLWLDIKIIIGTVFKGFMNPNAY
ncbi:undecaprenyl-phosphate glucose phosphotransferase [Endozoicomonas sp. GU-1]|uniref:undecaprenyl-phosphate glucose phosphotransferase n=1 Tax=Endozoicomonas sp. GU-1 TaxID=3009078 RepID=UPI0022B5CA18|nr:undecaprenyl-phosphate glucose phosphotransferase [Endozoicomonas sp. GU-1]WBA81525.1 undecaprenyl-phosphate glucose phosphotransferase [Endozoicomonas sp. GU-1]WBA84474.1 undecaprenyl-phosphate glucose phosphotransferase [Endozoicomonas sp. GU-1]